MRIIGGEARGKKLVAPRDDSIRPALDRIRESIFGTLDDVFVGQSVLDLFAGVGSIGLEAVSRGARRAVFVDQGKDALLILKQNIDQLGFSSRCEVIAGDALQQPKLSDLPPRTYALVFVDPPFAMFADHETSARILDRVQEFLSSGVLTPGGQLLLRHPSTWTGKAPLSVKRRKIYGESTILYFSSDALPDDS